MMKFKFDPNQAYQVQAIEAAVDILLGQPRIEAVEVVPKLASSRIKGRQVPSHGAFFIGRDALDPTLFLHTRNRTRSFGTTFSAIPTWHLIGSSQST